MSEVSGSASILRGILQNGSAYTYPGKYGKKQSSLRSFEALKFQNLIETLGNEMFLGLSRSIGIFWYL